ncbi:MAG: DUF2788 domain-containing protein [Rhodoferax sp.]
MFGYSEEQVTDFAITYLLPAFMAYMLFIIGQLAWKNKVGKTGTLVLFFALALGMTGFIAKYFIQWYFNSRL